MSKPMTAADYKKYLLHFNLTQKRGGEILGIAVRTSQAYVAGTRTIPAPTAKLVRLLMRGRIKPEDVADL